ncbi:unnamed protein product (macronuclear) [Paramecium tetraurelia]|uniref:Aquaporin n=1 Tax=Paramecium tetraurelia TaxID=5888 RepID=A0CI10_PARTE|nr:uncharacterized protein GSPATT00038530001 [Paramecium tetraurelia]CAK70427.1 unnamed protein product [Paramecium tetraurelia]|eukprot:XP_001437824.1 hypothetical protein (macronuclear) [Paramecium tetraurelia strain d4-2]
MEPTVNQFQANPEDSKEKEAAQISNIVVFETAGTLLVIYGALAAENNFGLSLVYFISLTLFGRLSGGYFNPICTLVGFIDGAISKKKTLYYIGSQILASLVAGMLFMPLFANSDHLPYYESLPTHQVFGTLMSEIAGSVIFFTFIQIQTAENTKITTTQIQSTAFITRQQQFDNYFIGILPQWAIVYLILQLHLGKLLNKHRLQLFYGIYYGRWSQMINLLMFVMGPWIGALLAITFYWKIYTPTLISKSSS